MNIPVCIRDNTQLFENFMTSPKEQKACHEHCPPDCQVLSYEAFRDTKLVLPEQECLDKNTFSITMKNIQVKH